LVSLFTLGGIKTLGLRNSIFFCVTKSEQERKFVQFFLYVEAGAGTGTAALFLLGAGATSFVH
jgi:hypothetical protein